MLKGEQAVREIIEKIASGEYRMLNQKRHPLQWLRRSTNEWVPMTKYHRNTVIAAQRRLKYRFDSVAMHGIYEVAA
jgi:hypothetical protein